MSKFNKINEYDIEKIKTKDQMYKLFNPYLLSGNTIMISKIAVDVGLKKNDPVLLLVAADIVSRYLYYPDLAVTLLRKSILYFPDKNKKFSELKAEIEIALATQLMFQGQENEALSLYIKVVETHKELKLKVGEELTGALVLVGNLELALKVARSWVAEGIVSSKIYHNMGTTLRMLNRSEEAIPIFKMAMELEPHNLVISFGYGITLLKSGDYKEGFKYFADHETFSADPSWWFVSKLPRLMPDSDVKGKNILFFQEQGLGDTLQFVRFIPQLLAKGAKITLAVPLAIKRLLSISFPDVKVVLDRELGKADSQEYRFDFSCPIPDLAYICHVESDADIPANVPYLRASEADIRRFSKLIDDILPQYSDSEKVRLRVGIIWGGDRRQKASDVASDMRRSTHFKDMIKAFTPADVDFFSLQYDKKRMELINAKALPQPVYDLMGEVHDMADTAALMENLDLIISVDTSPLHLSGALAKPTWLVNRWDSCWRWKDRGEESVWYPTLRIFRSHEKSFLPVLEEIGAALRKSIQN